MMWVEFGISFFAFFLFHSVPVRPPVKPALVKVLGPRGFTLVYSVLSVVMLWWLTEAASRAPYVELWPQMPWQRHVVLFGMLAACLIFALSIGRPNPFSFGGAYDDRFDPARPGFVKWTRHPPLLAITLWAGLHLLPNGDLAHVILFGVFAAFGFLGMRMIDRRKRRIFGEDRWMNLRDRVAAAPLLQQPDSWLNLAWRLASGLAVFVLLIVLHPIVFGVSPVP